MRIDSVLLRKKNIVGSVVLVLFGVTFVGSVWLSGCESPVSEPDPTAGVVFQPYPWPVASPASLGLDSLKIDSAVSALTFRAGVLSFLIVRHDTLALEYYRTGYTKHNDFDVRSATKSVVSLLLGIAIDDGHVDSLDARFLDEVPEFRSPSNDPRVDNLTLRHLLTMRAGFDYVDGGRNSDVVAASGDWIATFLGLPLISDPGARFGYSSLQAHLLSAVIARRTHMSTLEYATDRLFTPLQITARAWNVDPKGVHNGGTGLWLTPRDMARIGQLVLRRGSVGDKQVVSSNWIDSLATPRNVQDGVWLPMGAVNYGYLWWLPREFGNKVVLAAGYGGQFIWVDPSRDLIIVSTAEPPSDGFAATEQEHAILDVIVRFILPSVSGTSM